MLPSLLFEPQLMLKPSLGRQSKRLLQRGNPEVHSAVTTDEHTTHHERIAYAQTT
jgi:hypothetical protein